MSNEEEIILIPDKETGKFIKPFCCVYYKTKEEFEFMEAAVRKAKAEKTIERYTRYDINGEYDGDFCKCPNCKHEIIDGYNLGGDYNYCPDCGQKLDWSEAE